MKKKGFTLVELLAVIVIMAILALIAIPITISIISDSRENSHKRSIENYGREVENAYLQAKMDKTQSLPNNLKELEERGFIKVTGEKVVCDKETPLYDEDKINLTNCMVVDENGNQKSKYLYNYIDGKLEQVKTEEENSNNESNDNNGTNEVSYQEYHIGDEVTLINHGNERYYVIADSDSTQEYVTLLKADPLTLSQVNKYGSSISLNVVDKNGYGAIVYGSDGDYNNSNVKVVVDAWASEQFDQDDLINEEGYGSRIITYDELSNDYFNYKYVNTYVWQRGTLSFLFKTDNTPIWIYENSDIGYWTMSKYDEYGNIWAIKNDFTDNGWIYGCASGLYRSNSALVRPVINIYKSKITNQ